MKKKLPLWARCLLALLFTAVISARMWIPITEKSGSHYTLILEEVRSTDKAINLYFDGRGDYFRLARNAATEPLLSPEALGQEYEIIARHNNRRRGADYYIVYALTGTDGTVYRSLEESEATRQAALPTKIALTAGLIGVTCALIVFDDKKRKRAKEESA